MSLLALALAASAVPQRIEPVLWLNPRGSLLVNGEPVKGRLTSGAQTVRTPLGAGLDLDGKRGGLLVPDLPAFSLPKSVTIATWVYLRQYAPSGYQAQILFRGDDRDAHDPYSLCVLPDRTVQFRMDDPDGNPITVAAEIPLKRWTHVTASFDAEAGELRLWRGERLVATRETDRKLVVGLDAGQAPGLGIGNIQNDKGRHNQPLDGTLVDLRLYGAVVTPSELGYKTGWDKITP